jgi:guanylate kinase
VSHPVLVSVCWPVLERGAKVIRKGLLVVISSPSGGGKTTICERLRRQNVSYRYSVSVTTRPSRKGEVDGQHYNFVSPEEFRRRVREREFAEWAQVHGYYYGTLKKYVDNILYERQIALFDLDVQGGLQIKKAYPQSVLVFVLPPNIEVLERRLRGRKTDDEEIIRTRLENSRAEMEYWPQYDYVVVNDKLDSAVSQVQAIIEAELCRVSRIEEPG